MKNVPINLRMNLTRIIVNPNAAPKALHQIMWTRVGHELEIAAGFFDLNELRNVIEEGKRKQSGSNEGLELAVDVKIFITDRFTVSPEIAGRIYEEFGKLIADLRQEGLLASPDQQH